MKTTSGNQSLARATAVLEYLADHPAARLRDVAAYTGLAAPTALRFLTDLVSLGYLRSRERCYWISARVAALARGVVSEEMGEVVAASLRQLAEACRLTAYFVICEDDEALYLQRAVPRQATLIATQRIGHRAPLYCTGVGKLFLAARDAADIEAYAQRVPLRPLTEHTLTDVVALRRRLDEVRRQGFALDEEECELGVRCVAVPVRDARGRVRAALSVSGPSSVVVHPPEPVVLSALRAAANAIAAAMPEHLLVAQGGD